MRKLYIYALLLATFAYSEENQKPFIKEHKKHTYKVDIINASVYQQIDDYSAIYNTTHLFFEYNFNKSQLIFLNSSITFGDGITKHLENNGYYISSTADDLESYLKDINDTGRKYILELYYQKKVENFVFVGGLIDSTAFIDTNNFANDEHTQFLNSAFVNNPIAVLPSYNLGIYGRYKLDSKNSLAIVFMDNSPENENVVITQYEKEDENYSVRIYAFNTTETDRRGIGISSDFNVNENLGAFFRGGYANQDLNIFISAGFEKFNNFFDKDSFGFAIGFVNGKNYEKDIYIVETFYEINPEEFISLTFDIQYMKQFKEDFIFGTRLYLSY